MAIQVFISWSGELSRKLAETIRQWLPATLQFVKPYFTPVDIEKGTKWGAEISAELEKSNVGIICLTSENLSNPWVLFEAGALSKKLESRVCTLLFGLEPANVTGPLTLFQHTRFRREDFKKLVETINNAGGDSKLPAYVLHTVFEKFWPDLQAEVAKILAEHQPADNKARRSVEEMVEEILELTRLQGRQGMGTVSLRDLLQHVHECGHQDALKPRKVTIMDSQGHVKGVWVPEVPTVSSPSSSSSSPSSSPESESSESDFEDQKD